MIKYFILFTLILNMAYAGDDHGLWSLRWHFVNTLIAGVIIFFALKKVLRQKFIDDHDQLIKEIENCDKNYEQTQKEYRETQVILGDVETEIRLLKSRTRDSLEQYKKLKEQLKVERENHQKIVLKQKKQNLRHRFSNELYNSVMEVVVKEAKEELKHDQHKRYKVEEGLIN